VHDFKDFRDDGGIVGGRFAVKPLKFTEKPIIGGLEIGALYVRDLNQFAPARNWDYTLTPDSEIDNDLDDDNITDGVYLETVHEQFYNTSVPDSIRERMVANNEYDTLVEHKDKWASDYNDAYAILGFDASVPIISSKILNLTLYGQFAMSQDPQDDDDTSATKGWGLGAPGVALNVGPFRAQVEYRRTQGEFTPGFFGPYYEEERLRRNPVISDKEQRLIDEQLNGVYGTLGANIQGVLVIDGRYQYLVPQNDSIDADHRFEAIASIGDKIISRIPKLNKAEAFVYKANIFAYDEAFFEKTPDMYWGYRVGFEIMPGAGLIWETRYGWEYDTNNELVVNNNISIEASLTF
jgi:hypothetical protein